MKTQKATRRRNRLGRRVSNLFVWMQSGVRVADSQCGFRVYPLDFLREVHCHAGRYGFETEVITRAGWAGRPIVGATVRCHYFPKGKAVSHFRPYLDSFRGVPMHLRLMLRALSPLPRATPGQDAGKTLWRRLIEWLNPMPAIRQLREDDAGGRPPPPGWPWARSSPTCRPMASRRTQPLRRPPASPAPAVGRARLAPFDAASSARAWLPPRSRSGT